MSTIDELKDENELLSKRVEKLKSDLDNERQSYGEEIQELKNTLENLLKQSELTMKKMSRVEKFNDELLTDDEDETDKGKDDNTKTTDTTTSKPSVPTNNIASGSNGSPDHQTSHRNNDFMKPKELVNIIEEYKGSAQGLNNYIQQVNNLFAFVDPRDEKKYVHLLIAGTLRGDAAEQLQGIQINKLSEYTSHLQNYFGGEENLEIYRMQRNEMQQEAGESIHQLGKRFSIILRKIRNSINSKSAWTLETKNQQKLDEEKATIDRFMHAIRNKNLFLLLKATTYTTLNSAIESAKVMEKSVEKYDTEWKCNEKRVDKRTSRRHDTSGRSNNVRDSTQTYNKEKPYYKCTKCNKEGHTEKYCRSNGQNFQNGPRSSKDPPRTRINQMETGNNIKRTSQEDRTKEEDSDSDTECSDYGSKGEESDYTSDTQLCMYQSDDEGSVEDY